MPNLLLRSVLRKITLPLGSVIENVDALADHRLQLRLLQGQRPEVDRLARLVHRLVGAQHQPPLALQLDGLVELLDLAVRLRGDAQFVAAAGPIRHVEPRAGVAGLVRRQAGQLDRLAARGLYRASWIGTPPTGRPVRWSNTASAERRGLPASSRVWPRTRRSNGDGCRR